MSIVTNIQYDFVNLMDNHLRTDLLIKDGKLQEKKLWENTYIKHQIDKREKDEVFTVSDHIRGMVYAMLSSGIAWERVESEIDLATGQIQPIDEIFHDYDVNYILKCDPNDLANKINEIGCSGQSTWKQMQALITVNIPKMIKFAEEYGSIDNYYQTFINEDRTVKSLVKALSYHDRKDKMSELGEALTAEYLRNVGYNISKPDRHIRRILGSKYLACFDKEIVPIFKAFDIIAEIAEHSHRPVAEVDYILWSYCAKGYGEICTKNTPKCDICVAKGYCKYLDK